MIRTAVLALVLAGSASAQPIWLQRWDVPAGASVCGVGTFDSTTRLTRSGDAPVEISGTGRATVCWSAFEVRDGRLVGTDEVLTDFSFTSRPDSTGAPDRTNPMTGVGVRVARELGGSWHARLRDGQPTEEQAAYLEDPYLFDLDDAVYPAHPVSAGDSWTVPDSILARHVGSLVTGAPVLFSVRLDSLGERDGRRVAFLTSHGRFSRQTPDGPMEVHQTRITAFDLDWGIETWADAAYRSTYSFTEQDARGKALRADVKMARRSEVVRTVVLPGVQDP